MSLKIWFLLVFGILNHQLQLRAEDERNSSCAAHEKWTVFQRRKFGNVDFNRGWDDYVKGFGDCDGDFWLGLEELHQLTKDGDMSLEINMMTRGKKDHLVAKHSHFRIGSGSDNYTLTLHVSGYSGNAPYEIIRNYNAQFSTKDADHASEFEGGWWYRSAECTYTNLNGNFHKTDWNGFWWGHYYDDQGRLQRHFLCCSEMKIYKRL